VGLSNAKTSPGLPLRAGRVRARISFQRRESKSDLAVLRPPVQREGLPASQLLCLNKKWGQAAQRAPQGKRNMESERPCCLGTSPDPDPKSNREEQGVKESTGKQKRTTSRPDFVRIPSAGGDRKGGGCSWEVRGGPGHAGGSFGARQSSPPAR
jgi:hypothetical protein